MSFSELPLVLAEDILEMVVATTSDIVQILSMRLVSRIFEYEITQFFARMHLHGSLRGSPTRILIDRIPDAFKPRLIHAYLGEGDRRDTHFTSKMHAVIDFLWDNLEGDEKPQSRHALLENVCKALVLGGYHYHIFGDKRPPKPEKGYNVGKRLTYQTSYILAIAMGCQKLQRAMLDSGTGNVHRSCRYLGYPLDMAIRSGQHESVRIICELLDGTEGQRKGAFEAVKDAAKNGHTQAVLEMLNFWVAPTAHHHPAADSSKEVEMIQEILNTAANHGHWDIINHFLDTHPSRSRVDWSGVIIGASRYGNDALIRRLIGHDFYPGARFDTPNLTSVPDTCLPSFLYPSLSEAVLGGHLGTCKLLLEETTRRGQCLDKEKTSALWYEATIGNNLHILQFLHGCRLVECVLPVLPLAAEKGFLEIAKFALEEDINWAVRARNPPGGSLVSPVQGRARFLALLRAIVRNQVKIVSWLISEVGVDINNDVSAWVDLDLIPLVLAVDAGHVEMVNTLLQFGAKPLEKDHFEVQTTYNYRKARQESLYDISSHLGFSKGLQDNYIGSQDRVEAAYWAACQTSGQ